MDRRGAARLDDSNSADSPHMHRAVVPRRGTRLLGLEFNSKLWLVRINKNDLRPLWRSFDMFAHGL